MNLIEYTITDLRSCKAVIELLRKTNPNLSHVQCKDHKTFERIRLEREAEMTPEQCTHWVRSVTVLTRCVSIEGVLLYYDFYQIG